MPTGDQKTPPSLSARSPRIPGGRASLDTSRPTRPPWAGRRLAAGRRRKAPPWKTLTSRVVGWSTASWTQPLRVSRPIIALRSMIPSMTSAVVSNRKRERTGSWISTICQGRPVRRSLAAPSITPEQRGQVVRQLRAGAVTVVVDVREVVFQVDPRADRVIPPARRPCRTDPSASSSVGSYEVRKARRSRKRPRVHSRRPTIVIALVACPSSGRVCARSSERSSTWLRAAAKESVKRRRHEPPAALVGVALAGRLDDPSGRLELVPVRGAGGGVEVEEDHRVVAGVVVPADEDGVGRGGSARAGQAFADPGRR